MSPVGSVLPHPESAERRARVALNALSEPGDPRVARLVAALGAQEVHDRLLHDTDLAGLRSETALRLAGLDPRRILDEAAALGIRFVIPGDPEWPPGVADLSRVEPLNRMAGPPLGLWVKGPGNLADLCRTGADLAVTGGPDGVGRDDPAAVAVALVGSRSATTYGVQVARDLGAELASAGSTVVSGAAYGIDQAAHRGCLAGGGPTIAVLACGLDRAYPAGHKDLLAHIGATGLLVSELRHGCSPTRARFLGRNRLIAALTAGTVVVEAAVRSGALNTASWATRLHRLVMGVPGPVTSAPSEGVHELIRTGEAVLVTRGAHVLEAVAPAGQHLVSGPRAPETARDRLPPSAARVLEAVPVHSPALPQSIARTAGLSAGDVRAQLVALAADGWVEEQEGRWRQCVR